MDGRASVTKDEKRVLRGSWTVMSLCRYEGWVVAVVYWGVYAGIRRIPTSGFFDSVYSP